ncbi:HNH endonuclease [Methylobrevis albus]|uniref:HNH endonuclease n=1 Tax=Methylobrevis albus TaxID=2793297 RepID=A0A931N0U0_9HYPH|nr:HNH endonuclease [Methylobrevis albus]
MPSKPRSICHCGKVAVQSGQHCPCAIARQREARAAYDATRPSASARGYNAEWRALRSKYLKANPLCSHEYCKEQATEVDHIVSIKNDTSLRLNWSNLRAYCRHHHSQRTSREQGFAKSRL